MAGSVEKRAGDGAGDVGGGSNRQLSPSSGMDKRRDALLVL